MIPHKHKEILDFIRRYQPISKLDLLKRYELTTSTMTRLLEELLSAGKIIEAGYGDSTGGRKPFLYQINPAYGYVVGLEISRAYSHVAIYDYNMNKMSSYKWEMPGGNTQEALLPMIAVRIDEMLAEHHISPNQLLGMGIGSVKGWMNQEIVRFFEKKLSIPVTLDNGANTALLGEYWAEPTHINNNLVYIHVGVGLRLSMMSDGELLSRSVDQEDSFGQMIIQTDGIRLGDQGNYGNLESYVSIPAMIHMLHHRLKLGRGSLLHNQSSRIEEIGFQDLLEALENDDALVKEVVTESACYFGIGLANVINIVHPEKVILGGPLIHSHPLFFEVATQAALSKIYHPKAYEMVFSKGKIGEEAVVYGAAIMIIQQLMDQIE